MLGTQNEAITGTIRDHVDVTEVADDHKTTLNTAEVKDIFNGTHTDYFWDKTYATGDIILSRKPSDDELEKVRISFGICGQGGNLHVFEQRESWVIHISELPIDSVGVMEQRDAARANPNKGVMATLQGIARTIWDKATSARDEKN